GEVYRAKDPRLGREVAIKVLPASFSQDADRLRRFEQEAKAAGVLNHPNLTAVYDIGTHDDAPYGVQELLEGETLRSALVSGKLPPRRAIDYAIQIVQGLAAAHEKGIVHRDLKPENLFVTKDDRLKILDFGLAKLTHTEEGSQATSLPTATAGTEPGVVLGTLGYMSPEQVRGKSADARSDIFSFGAILYEMLSGKRAFHGDSAADTMSAILKEDPPDLSVTNQVISPGLERIVRHCLEKNPERRFQSARDLAFNLEALSATSAATSIPGAIAAARPPRRWPLVAAGVIAIAALGLLAGRQIGRRGAAHSGGAPIAFQQLTDWAGHENTPALSPDGQTFAYTRFSASSEDDVWAQRVGGQAATNLTKDCGEDDNFGVFSPDGSLIAYHSDCKGGGIFLMGATGENVRRLASFGFNPDWFPDGKKVVFSTRITWNGLDRSSGHNELWTAELGSGKTAKLYGGDAVQPSVSPHGQRVAFWAIPEGGSRRDIWTIPAEGLKKGEKPVPVTQDAAIDWNPIWSPDGRSLYFLSDRNGTLNLWRIPIDETSGRPRGDPQPVTLPARAIMQFRLSRDGRKIIYMAREWSFHLERLPLDAGRGVTAAASEIWSGTMIVDHLAVSRDGNWLGFGSLGKQEDIYLMRSDGSGLKKLTDDAWRDRHPTFSPDGQTIAFQSDRIGRWELWTIGVDGSAPTQLTRTSGESPTNPIWSPDGAFIAFVRGRDSYLLSMGGGQTAGRIEPVPPPGPGLSFEALAWTPDSQRLIGLARRDAADARPAGMAYTLSAKSYSKLSLSGALKHLEPLRDGRHILFSSDERQGIAILDTGSGESRTLLSPGGRYIQTWAISPDEKFLYYNHATQEADIWLATLE
ncbi:MAG: protein kinase domain-containing protein, partial [Thermoanaerobaculia bacterium]